METTLEKALSGNVEVAVIGGGIRSPPRKLPSLERVVNAAHGGAPDASSAFNTSSEHSAYAAERWLRRAGAASTRFSHNVRYLGRKWALADNAFYSIETEDKFSHLISAADYLVRLL